MTEMATASVPPPATVRHRLGVFGLTVIADWAIPGAIPVGALDALARRATTLRLVPAEAINAEWAKEAERIAERNLGADEPLLTVERTDSHYRIWAMGYGRYLVSLDGTGVVCERDGAARHVQERFLVAQILPLAAVLQGIELLHASAVRIDGRVVAFTGPPGVGKTTMTTGLILRGADFVTDDVLAVTTAADAVIAHPGAPFIAVVEEDWTPRLGPALGVSDKVTVSVPCLDAPQPLTAIYHLEPATQCEIVPLESGLMHRVLASAFVSYLSTPARLARQLEMATRVAAAVPQFLLSVPKTGDTDVVRAVESHIRKDNSTC